MRVVDQGLVSLLFHYRAFYKSFFAGGRTMQSFESVWELQAQQPATAAQSAFFQTPHFLLSRYHVGQFSGSEALDTKKGTLRFTKYTYL